MSRSLQEMKANQKALQLISLAENAFSLNNFELAKDSLVECLQLNPKNSRANELLAYIQGNNGNVDQALKLLEIACLDPNCSAGALYELGSLYLQRNNPKLAIPPLKKALKKAGAFFEGLHDLGLALASTGSALDGVKSLEEAAKLNPHSAELFYNIGRTYHDLKLTDKALKFYQKAIGIDPKFAKALVNQGILFHDQKRYQESLTSFDTALTIDPLFADAWLNKGFCLHSLMLLDEAVFAYEKAIALDPNLAEAHFNLGLTLLLQGKLEQGFQAYEWRWKCKEFLSRVREFEEPQWKGDFDLKGKRILLHNEQGLGDAIQFSRYTKVLESHGAKVLLEVDKSLFGLFSDLGGVEQLIEKGQPLPPFDCHSPLMSLPLALNTELENIPKFQKYLMASHTKKVGWQRRLGEKDIPRIGIVWSSFSTHSRDSDRSLPLETFIQAFPQGQFELISLQQKMKDRDNSCLVSRGDIKFFGGDIKDFSDTAAIIDCLDLLITVDTSVAHLGGALGKETWILLPYCPDWRWLVNMNTSPWYPSVQLFRQSQNEDWDKVIQKIAIALKNLRPSVKNI